jgi:hypothetical protein
MSHGDLEHDCLNCGTELQGRFCHACGQKAGSLEVGVHDFVHEASHEFLHLDGKILNTMKLLLLKPGQLTREFLDGRRARYISPIRLYLTWSVLFFALVATVPQFRQSFISVGSGKPKQGVSVGTKTPVQITASSPAEAKEAERLAGELGEQLTHQLPRAMFLLMPFFALLTWIAWRKQERFYVPHLYYSIHVHAFAFFLLTLMVTCGALGRPGKAVGSLLFFTLVPYHFIALRRTFGGTHLATLLKGTLIGMIYFFSLAAVVGGLVWLVVRGAH